MRDRPNACFSDEVWAAFNEWADANNVGTHPDDWTVWWECWESGWRQGFEDGGEE